MVNESGGAEDRAHEQERGSVVEPGHDAETTVSQADALAVPEDVTVGIALVAKAFVTASASITDKICAVLRLAMIVADVARADKDERAKVKLMMSERSLP